MPCDVTRQRIGALLDGELPGVEALTLRAHIEICPACAQARDELNARSE